MRLRDGPISPNEKEKLIVRVNVLKAGKVGVYFSIEHTSGKSIVLLSGKGIPSVSVKNSAAFPEDGSIRVLLRVNDDRISPTDLAVDGGKITAIDGKDVTAEFGGISKTRTMFAVIPSVPGKTLDPLVISLKRIAPSAAPRFPRVVDKAFKVWVIADPNREHDIEFKVGGRPLRVKTMVEKHDNAMLVNVQIMEDRVPAVVTMFVDGYATLLRPISKSAK